MHSQISITAFLSLAGLLLIHQAAAQTDMQQRIITQSTRMPGKAVSPTEVVNRPAVGVVPEQFAHLKLAPGDLVSLTVLDDSDYTGQFRVDTAGDITVPQIGIVHVLGESIAEARQAIAKLLLDRGLLRDPQVELDLIEYSAPQVTVLGEVGTPGIFPLLGPQNLEDVLALAGGPTMMAGDQIEITSKKEGSVPVEVRYSRQMASEGLKKTIVHPGDTVKVKRAGVVYVLGSVNRPGGYIMQEDGKLSVLQAVSIAGGTTFTASTGSVYVLRKNDDDSVVWLQIAYNKMTHGKASDLPLHANDVLFIPMSRFKATFSSTQSVLASAASASIYAAAVY